MDVLRPDTILARLRELAKREPGLVVEGARALDEKELAMLLFGADARITPKTLRSGASSTTPYWFETRVAVHVDAAWLTDGEVSAILDRLGAMAVRVTPLRVDESAAVQPPTFRLVVVLELLRGEKPRPAPPPTFAVKRYRTSTSFTAHELVCPGCRAVHHTSSRAKGYPGEERERTIFLCHDCGREELTHEHYGDGGVELVPAEHPDAAVYRRAADAFRRKDLAAVAETLHEDIVWHFPGTTWMAREIQGREGVLTFLQELTVRTSGSFTLADIAVHGTDHHVIAIQRFGAAHGGERQSFHASSVMRFEDRRQIERWFYLDDQDAFDAFFARF